MLATIVFLACSISLTFQASHRFCLSCANPTAE